MKHGKCQIDLIMKLSSPLTLKGCYVVYDNICVNMFEVRCALYE